MFSSKAANKELNRTHKRVLRVFHKDNDASFDTCLQRGTDTTIHVKNLQKLMIEILKTLNLLNPSNLWDFFSTKEVEYNLRIKNLVEMPQIEARTFGTHSLTFSGSLLWNALSDDIRNCKNIAAFKKNLKPRKGQTAAENYVINRTSYFLIFYSFT